MRSVVDDKVEGLIGELSLDDLVQSLHVSLISAVVQTNLLFKVALCDERVQKVHSCSAQLDGH